MRVAMICIRRVSVRFKSTLSVCGSSIQQSTALRYQPTNTNIDMTN